MATRKAWVLTGLWALGPAWGCGRVEAAPDPIDAAASRGGGSSVPAAATGLPAAAPAASSLAAAGPSEKNPKAPDPEREAEVMPPPTPASDAGSGGPAPTGAGNAYPGSGFVLHEWGTNTVVSASDGSLALGLHHEEEDLPDFVYDRMKVSSRDPNIASVKMETPVAYFYSDTARRASARVDFPRGILTQWYPGAVKFAPLIPGNGPAVDLNALKDPALDPSVVLTSQHCLDYYRTGGSLDWGTFDLLPPDAPRPPLAEAALDAFTWSYARDVAANFVKFPGGESERFLFYRGVSNVELPARAEALPGGRLRVHNLRAEPLGPVFVVRVSQQGAAFVLHAPGVGGLETLELVAPDPSSLRPLPEFLTALAARVTEVLEQSGLYRDESVAMVNTWQRQWFRSPGLRLLYLAPSAWIDAVIPLTVSPVPDAVVRTMMIRVDLLTPETEAEDVAALSLMANDAGQGRAHFAALGRFAEPRLRRALTLFPSGAGSSYLEELRHGVDRTSLTGE